MGDEDNGLLVKLLPNGITKDVVGHMSIQGAEWVIQDVNVAVTVEGTGQADPLALPTT